jgi:polyisoprenoid-binding protein YceI
MEVFKSPALRLSLDADLGPPVLTETPDAITCSRDARFRRLSHDQFMNAMTPSLPLAPGRWAVDHNHSSINFSIRHLGVSKVRGRFTRFDAEVVIGETIDNTSVTATIDMSSIDTANADRDAHVLSPDIIDVERRPILHFRSTRIAGAGAEWQVDGDLSIGGVTRPVTLAVEFGGIETLPGGPRHAGFEATTEIRRKDFGINVAMPPGVSAVVLGDTVKIELDIQLLEPEVAAA